MYGLIRNVPARTHARTFLQEPSYKGVLLRVRVGHIIPEQSVSEAVRGTR